MEMAIAVVIPVLFMIYVTYEHFRKEKLIQRAYSNGKQEGKKEAVEQLLNISIQNEIKKE